MEESFKMRAEKLFGSHLFQTVPNSSFPISSWSVTDGEVEKKEWNRERGVDPDREDTPCASAYYNEDGCLKKKNRRRRGKRLEVDDDDQDDDDEKEEEEEGRMNGYEEEERDIKNSIGLDSTLDREDEEDEFDMAAICKEKIDDRVYMRDVTDHGPFINYHSVVSDLPEHLSELVDGSSNKDPRADHLAASIRLREDQSGGNIMCPITDKGDIKMTDCHMKITTVDPNLKPILKRKKQFVVQRPKKHVRFNSSYEDDQNTISTISTKDSLEIIKSLDATPVITTGSRTIPDNSPAIPDYLRNPSKYVCYQFDESDGIDAQSNQQAFADFQNILRRNSNPAELEAGSIELPKSVKFTPRKKTGDLMLPADKELGAGDEYVSKDSISEIVRSNCIAVEAQESETCAMEEDDNVPSFVSEKGKTAHKLQRKYRPKSTLDECSLSPQPDTSISKLLSAIT